MNQTTIGAFIAARRKAKHLTQLQLARKLNITDRAVSKWETGKSMPDASIMLPLCDILGITVNELLSGEELTQEEVEEKADENLLALQRKDERSVRWNRVTAIALSSLMAVGILACLICDLSISGTLTWSWIPVSSILYAWAVIVPAMRMGAEESTWAWGIDGAYDSISVRAQPSAACGADVVHRHRDGGSRTRVPMGGGLRVSDIQRPPSAYRLGCCLRAGGCA